MFFGLPDTEEIYSCFLVYVRKSVQMFVPIRRPRQARKYRALPSLQSLIAKKHFLWQEGCVPGDFAAFKKFSSDAASKTKEAARIFEKKLIYASNHEKIFKYLGNRLKSRNATGVILDESGKEVSDKNTQSQVFTRLFDSVFIEDNGIFCQIFLFVPVASYESLTVVVKTFLSLCSIER